MKQIKIVFLMCAFACMSFSNKVNDGSCSILHSGTFKYSSPEGDVKVVIDGNRHTEYHKGGKYIIQSTLTWVSECEYNMTIVKVTIPDFPFGKGASMNVKVDNVEDQTIYYTSTIQGQSWKGVLQKIK